MIEKLRVENKKLKRLKKLPTVTADGHQLKLLANLESLEEMESIISSGAEGIGLYRTEFLYLTSDVLPNEEEQYKVYYQVAKAIDPYFVTIRTIDLGGDKIINKIRNINVDSTECNPFLGLRSIRFCLRYQEIFRIQLKAILRASKHGNIRILIPMVSTVEELWKTKEILNEIKTEFDSKQIKYDKNIQIGVMIEVPSAALQCEVIAKDSDFLSIGTNDLIQYTLAVDRMNEDLAGLYEPLHPAVLKLIKQIIDAGKSARKTVSMCGEMASDPSLTGLLIGLGLEEFSVPSVILPKIKNTVRNLAYKEVKILAEEVIKQATTSEVKNLLKKLQSYA